MENLDYKILLEISQAIATVRDSQDLLRLVMERIRPIFGFYDAGIFVVDASGEYHRDLTVEMPEVTFSEGVEKLYDADLGVQMRHRGSSIEADMEHCRAARSPVILSFAEIFAEFPDHPFREIMEQTGYVETIGALLKARGETIGIFYLNSLVKGFFTPAQFPLFEAIADQVAIAVSNILANEEIKEREREKSILLSISEDVASARNAVELLQIIREKAQLLIPFYDTGILIVEDDGEHHYDLAVNITEWDVSEGNQKLRAAGLHRMVHHNSYVAHVMQLIETADNPVIEDYELRHKQFDYPFFQIGEEVGYKEAIVAELKTRGKVFGTLWLNSLEKNHFKPAQFEIFQALADQVAVAVSNILANEEIIEREREKSQLLEITELIAQVKATDDLLKLIVDKINPLFGFHDCGLFVVSPDGKTHTDLAAVLPDVSPSEWNEQIAAVSADIPHANSLIEWCIEQVEAAGQPILCDFVELVENFPDYPQFAGTNILEMGYRDCLIANLLVRGKPIGVFCINALQKNYFRPQIFPLFQAVTHSISIAVANILANEEILEREREKEAMLSIAEAIAAIRKRDELLTFIVEKVQPLLGFNQYAGINILNEADNKLYNFFTTATLEELEHEAIQPLLKGFPAEGLFGEILASREPVVKDDSWIHQSQACEVDQWAADIWKQLGFKQSVSVSLRNGDRIIGSFHTHYFEPVAFSQSRLRWFEGIADQLAVAVANILANEEILEREKEKTKLLSISEQIAKVQNRQQLLKVIFSTIKNIFPYDDAGLFYFCDAHGKINPNGDYHVHLLDDLISEINIELVKSGAVGVIANANGPIRYLATEKPTLITLEAVIKAAPGHPHYPIMRKAGIKQVIAKAIKRGGETIGMLCFNSFQEGFYSEKDFSLFENIANQLAVAVSNILANEEVLRLSEERRQRAEELAQTNDALQRSMRRLASEATPDAFVVQLHRELCELLGGEATAQFRVDWDAQRINGGVIVDDEQITPEELRHFTHIEFKEVPAWQTDLAEDRILLFDPERDAERMHQKTIEFMRERGLTWLINLPLYVRERPAWVVAVLGRDESKLTTRNLEQFRVLSRQLTLALELRQLSEEAEKAAILQERNRAAEERAAQLARTNDAVQRSTLGLSSLDNIELFIESVLNEIIRETEARGTGIFQIAPDGEHLQLTHYLEGSEMFDVATDPRLAVWRDAISIGQSTAAERMTKGELVWINGGAEEFGDDWKEPLAAHWQAGHKIIACVPFIIGGEFTGFVGISFGEAVNPTEQKMQMCQTLAQHAALALHLRLLSREAERAAQESAALNERNRIAGEIHDTLAQSFTGVVIQLQAAERVLEIDAANSFKHIETAIKVAREGLTEARRSVQALRPRALDDRGFVETLRQLLRRMTDGNLIKGDFALSGESFALPEDVSISLMRICQEAITNAVRHAAARNIRVELRFDGGNEIYLTITDDGAGFDSIRALQKETRSDGGFGLIGMKERAAKIGAIFEVASELGKGTRIVVRCART